MIEAAGAPNPRPAAGSAEPPFAEVPREELADAIIERLTPKAS